MMDDLEIKEITEIMVEKKIREIMKKMEMTEVV